MIRHQEKTSENKTTVTAANTNSSNTTVQLKDNRGQSLVQQKLAEKTTNQEFTSTPIQKKNNTGLPDNLKSGIENLSGHSMDDVKVHYNSAQPAQLNAHAYAQGSDIHIASGQEKHLPHEAWHVVQQKQGRVKPTLQMKGKVNINDDKGLENEADHFGSLALVNTLLPVQNKAIQSSYSSNIIQRNIIHDGTAYAGDSSRPGWTQLAEASLVDEYNIRHNTSHEELEYKKNKMDRCHIVSFDSIQSTLYQYLNKTIDESAFDAFITGLTFHSSTGAKISTSVSNLKSKINGGTVQQITTAANSLLSLLNSVPENLRAGDKYLNAYIQQNLDLFFEARNGKFGLTDHSKKATDIKQSGKILRTPEHKQRVITSEGPIAFGNMTPDSRQRLESRPFETKQIKSDNVKSKIYSKTSQVLPVKGYLTASTPILAPTAASTITKIDWAKLQISKLQKSQYETNNNISHLIYNNQNVASFQALKKKETEVNNNITYFKSNLGIINSQIQNQITHFHQIESQISFKKNYYKTLEEEKTQIFKMSSDYADFYNHQPNFYNGSFYNKQAHDQAYQNWSQYNLNAQPKIAQIDSQLQYYNQEIYQLNILRSQIHTEYLRLDTELKKINLHIPNLETELMGINLSIQQLITNNDVQNYSLLVNQYYHFSDQISKYATEIQSLRIILAGLSK